MVQAKNNKKSKSRKQLDGVKRHGKQTDIAEFRGQLDSLGLKIVEVTADGNCFFRALADQLEGHEDEYKKYRDMVVKYLVNHREEFEPFIEDDVPFDEYCQSMEKDGTWAGHMELQAASLVTRRNICIHRLRSPRWYISNFSGHQDNMIHLCYHDGEHYNSVRQKEDSCQGPAKPIVIKVDAHLSAKDHINKVTIDKSSKGCSHRSNCDSGSVKLVISGTGCEDIDKIEQVLKEVGGDIDATIEYLIAERAYDLDEDGCANGDSSNGEHNVQEDNTQNLGQPMEQDVRDRTIHHTPADEIHNQFDNDQNECKEKPENKDCSCRSKRKCKACGTATGKASSPMVNGKHVFNKGRKEPKRNKKKDVRETGYVSLPDMGALCI